MFYVNDSGCVCIQMPVITTSNPMRTRTNELLYAVTAVFWKKPVGCEGSCESVVIVGTTTFLPKSATSKVLFNMNISEEGVPP
jgi:hypothetical protein